MAASLFLPRSTTSTEGNKTGSWRFLRPRYDEKTAPCSTGCPTGEDIARIQMLTAQGLFKEAWETILYENPLPGVCGRVCYHPCEGFCNRREFDEAVAIHTVERFLADTAARYGLKPELSRLPSRPEKIAVVGAGPAGLAGAYFLTLLGYQTEVFEAMPEPGGMMRWGIPAYRLNAAALKEEIDRLAGMEIPIHCGRRVGDGFLREASESFQAVFFGSGHWRSLRLMIPGEELPVVKDGLAFLRKVREGDAPSVRGRVAVIGGGNTAVDVARCAVRLGADVTLVYRRRRVDMPAFEEEVRMAVEEGVKILELRAPVSIAVDGDDAVLALRYTRVVDADRRGRAVVALDPERGEELQVKCVFKAVGQEPEDDWLGEVGADGPSLDLGNCLLRRTTDGLPVVFGGDLAVHVKSVVHAVASGKESAMALDVLFREGLDAVRPRLDACRIGEGPARSMEIYLSGARSQRSSHVVRYDEINTDYFQYTPRIVQPRLLKEERVHTFSEIDLRISAAMAMRESERCFNCGICNQCDNCRLFCPDLAVLRDLSPRGRSIQYDYCKGCGVCVVECPRNAMLLEEEQTAGGESRNP